MSSEGTLTRDAIVAVPVIQGMLRGRIVGVVRGIDSDGRAIVYVGQGHSTDTLRVPQADLEPLGIQRVPLSPAAREVGAIPARPGLDVEDSIRPADRDIDFCDVEPAAPHRDLGIVGAVPPEVAIHSLLEGPLRAETVSFADFIMVVCSVALLFVDHEDATRRVAQRSLAGELLLEFRPSIQAALRCVLSTFFLTRGTSSGESWDLNRKVGRRPGLLAMLVLAVTIGFGVQDANIHRNYRFDTVACLALLLLRIAFRAVK